MNLAWGGYSNGLIPQSALVAVGKDSFGRTQYLEAGAARAYFALDAKFFAQFHKHLVVNFGYRDLATQEEFYAAYEAHPATNPYAAYPGDSNHGWARAADFGSGVQYAGTPEALWMKEHGPEYGFHPSGYGFKKVEPWHYDWLPGTATASLDLTPIHTEQDNDMSAIYYKPTDNSPVLEVDWTSREGVTFQAGYSRIWAGDGRSLFGETYSDLWASDMAGNVRRLTKVDADRMRSLAETGDIPPLVINELRGIELEQIVYAPRL